MSAIQSNERFIVLTAVEEHGEYYDDSGEWLPLEVWGQKGFDKEAILTKTRPEDRRMHPLGFETFRVVVLRTGHRGQKVVTKTDRLSAKSVPDVASPTVDGVPSALLAIGDKAGSSSSSSSSSSSASRHKKSKKSKKSKKDKKDKKEQKLKRKREAEAAKASVNSSAFVG